MFINASIIYYCGESVPIIKKCPTTLSLDHAWKLLTPHRIKTADKARILNNDQYIDQVEEKKPKVQENYVPTHWIAEHADKRQV